MSWFKKNKDDSLERIEHYRAGVLGFDQLSVLLDTDIIRGTKLTRTNLGLSTLDLHLSNEMWKMKGSIKGSKGTPYDEILNSNLYVEEKIDISEGEVLNPTSTYVVKLQESITMYTAFDLYGTATGRSSIGRLDVLTRLISDFSDYYDELPCPTDKGLENKVISLYVEITPITFKIKVKRNDKLNQLRIFRGPPSLCEINQSEMELIGNVIGGENIQWDHLSVDLDNKIVGDMEICAFRGKEGIIDYIDVSRDESYLDPNQFWVREPSNNGILPIECNKFYIIKSKERLKLPKDVAVYGQAMTESLGELRIHYAGFAHPLFGYYNPNGTPLIFEIRGHNVKAFLRDSERIAKIKYYKMSEPISDNRCKEEKENVNKGLDLYQSQELQLSSYFKGWEAE